MKHSVYMRWAKQHASAPYNLANSGILPCTSDELLFTREDVLLNQLSSDGYPPLIPRIADVYGAGGEQVVCADGTSGANFLVCAALLEPGDEVLVERPTYEPLLAVARFLGAHINRFDRRFEDGYRV